MARIILAVIAAACFLSGCTTVASLFPRSREKSEMEKLADDNQRLNTLYETEHTLNLSLAYDLEITRIELLKAREALGQRGLRPASEVPVFQDFEVQRVRFGFLTGLSDWDEEPGVDGLRVYLLPEDSEGTTLKRKGNCVFDLIDITGRKQSVIMSWKLPADELGATWYSIPPGFRLKLPWKGEVPWGHEVILRATYVDSYAREFQVSRAYTLEEFPDGVEPAETDKGDTQGGPEQ